MDNSRLAVTMDAKSNTGTSGMNHPDFNELLTVSAEDQGVSYVVQPLPLRSY